MDVVKRIQSSEMSETKQRTSYDWRRGGGLKRLQYHDWLGNSQVKFLGMRW